MSSFNTRSRSRKNTFPGNFRVFPNTNSNISRSSYMMCYYNLYYYLHGCKSRFKIGLSLQSHTWLRRDTRLEKKWPPPWFSFLGAGVPDLIRLRSGTVGEEPVGSDPASIRRCGRQSHHQNRRLNSDVSESFSSSSGSLSGSSRQGYWRSCLLPLLSGTKCCLTCCSLSPCNFYKRDPNG